MRPSGKLPCRAGPRRAENRPHGFTVAPIPGSTRLLSPRLARARCSGSLPLQGGSTDGRGEMTERWLDHTVTADEAGSTLQEVLIGGMGVSRRLIQKLTRARGITLNRQPGFLARKVRA